MTWMMSLVLWNIGVRSHLWGDGRVGTASQFFDVGDRFALHDAARREGIKDPEASLRIERLSVKMGGWYLGNGRLGTAARQERERQQAEARTWHPLCSGRGTLSRCLCEHDARSSRPRARRIE